MDELLASCRLCGKGCGVDRRRGETGYCRAGNNLRISAITPHFGEEPPISGSRGSGTIFFSYCSLRCNFCQNFRISHEEQGTDMEIADLVTRMLALQRDGCHNINLVTPTHYLSHIITALQEAKDQGLTIPVVYNTGGYDNPEYLSRLAGLVDIYMPDYKFYSSDLSRACCDAPDYPSVIRKNIKVMYEQTGPLHCIDGIAVRGMLIRHLVLPGYTQNSLDVIQDIYERIGNSVSISLMSQYHPGSYACLPPPLDRTINMREYASVVELLFKRGFTNGYVQSLESCAYFLPDFDNQDKPFTI